MHISNIRKFQNYFLLYFHRLYTYFFFPDSILRKVLKNYTLAKGWILQYSAAIRKCTSSIYFHTYFSPPYSYSLHLFIVNSTMQVIVVKIIWPGHKLIVQLTIKWYYLNRWEKLVHSTTIFYFLLKIMRQRHISRK